MAERPTFSPFWHRVRTLRPRLRPHVQITRQHYRGKRWHVVHDPATNQFYRLNPIAHEFVGLLDGKRTIEQIWEISLGNHGDDAPTQQEVIQLIGQLHNANLLSVDAAPETEQLLRRGRERVKKKAISQAMGIMYFRIRLFNPDALLAWIEPVLRPVLNRWGLLAWLGLVALALSGLIPEWSRLGDQFEGTIAPGNWGWMAAVFVLTKAFHELGHGVILKRFKGQVPEFGVMLLVLFPAPFVDASASWALESKWKRIAVGAGGMIFEIGLASIAALVWLGTRDGQLLHQLAYNAMFIAGVSTILFNANPLMRFDGYYILSDLIEVPNLMQRSQNMIKFFFKRYAYGMDSERPPSASGSERVVLTVFGLLALAYRVFLFFSITLFVMGKLFAVGLILAIWTGVMWFVLPIGKLVHWLASGPALAEHRARAIGATIAMVAIAALVLGGVPIPDWRRSQGIVEPIAQTGIFFGASGFVAHAHASPGDWLEPGDPIATLENPELVASLAQARAELRRFESLLREATQDQPIAVDTYRRRVEATESQIRFFERRLDSLVVRAPHAGVLAGPDPHSLVGAFVQEGQAIGEIVDHRSPRIVASLDQRENSWVIEAMRGELPVRVSVRFVSRAPVAVPAEIEQIIPAGQRVLRHPSLGYAGGGSVQTDPSDQSGTVAQSKQFVMLLRATPGQTAPRDSSGREPSIWTGAPGERVKLRFTLPSRPILTQFIDRMHKLMQGRVDL